jgi:hypothetical protein
LQGAAEKVFVGEGEDDVSCAACAPAAFYGYEDFGEFFDEGGLLFGREHQVAVSLFGGGEGGEDAVAYPEVGIAHVGGFLGTFEGEGDAAEVGDVHGGFILEHEVGGRKCVWLEWSVERVCLLIASQEKQVPHPAKDAGIRDDNSAFFNFAKVS